MGVYWWSQGRRPEAEEHFVGAGVPWGQAIGEADVSDNRQNAGNISFRHECRIFAGKMEDEERREGVGVLKEECHLSLRPHFRICHELSEYL